MAGTVKLKRSAVSGKIPSTSDLDLGELGINTFDGKLYMKKDDGTAAIVEIGSGGGGGGAVDSVNTQTGEVVLDADDIDDSSTSHKFATAAELASIGTAVQPGDLSTFLRSDTDDTFTGVLTISGSISNASTAGNSGAILGNLEVGYGGPYNSISARSNSSLHLNYNSSGTVFVGASNTVWHAGNDGAGSGLDADTVDGIQGANFLRSDVDDTTTGNITISKSDARLKLNSTDTSSPNYPGIDFDTANTQGASLECNIFDSELPIAGLGLVVKKSASNTETGTLSFNVLGDIYAGGTTLTGLNKVWHAGNDGAGSGLDADTVDGIQGANFLRSDVDDNTAGKLLIGGSYANNAYDSVSSTRLLFGGGNDQDNYFIGTNSEDYGGNYTKLDIRWHTGIRMGAQPNYGGTRIFNNEDLSTLLFSVGRGDGNTRVESGSLLIGGNTAWHAGNDGAGSGLDADTCDGQHLGTASSPTFSKIYCNGVINNTGSGAWFGRNHAYSTPEILGYGAELMIGCQSTSLHVNYRSCNNGTSGHTPTNWYWRKGSSSSWSNHYFGNIYSSSNTVWHAGNDGAGSGLDADTVDGIQGANFLRSDTADTATGTLTVRDIKISSDYHLQRSNHHSGHLEGSYNNVAANSYKSNPIYTIGSSYNPTDAALSNMYGIGYTHANNATFVSRTGATGWGMYVAADGDARIFLDGSNGTISSTGAHYVGSSTVWHAGNDGSGSGLDADTVDGIQGANFLRSDTTDTASGEITFNGRINIRGHADFSDSEYAYFGSSDDWSIHRNANNWTYINDLGNGIIFQDNGSNKVRLEDSGIFRPETNGSGYLGTSTYYWSNLYASNANISSTLNVRGAIDLADNDILRLGSGDDAELFCNGSHLYLDLNSGIGNFYIRDTTTTRYTFDDNGSFTATGNVTAYSDIKLKRNIEVIQNALEKVCSLRGVTYERIDLEGEDNQRQSGVIAQEVEKVLPEVVCTNEEGIKSVAYGNMVGLLIESIKEQQDQIGILKEEIKELRGSK